MRVHTLQTYPLYATTLLQVAICLLVMNLGFCWFGIQIRSLFTDNYIHTVRRVNKLLATVTVFQNQQTSKCCRPPGCCMCYFRHDLPSAEVSKPEFCFLITNVTERKDFGFKTTSEANSKHLILNNILGGHNHFVTVSHQ